MYMYTVHLNLCKCIRMNCEIGHTIDFINILSHIKEFKLIICDSIGYVTI